MKPRHPADPVLAIDHLLLPLFRCFGWICYGGIVVAFSPSQDLRTESPDSALSFMD